MYAAKAESMFSSQLAWRCYAQSALDATLSKYVSSQTYCTRDFALRSLISLHCQSEGMLAARIGVDGSIVGASSTPAAIGSTPVEELTIDVVVAHCHEPMNWLPDVKAGLQAAVPQVKLSLLVYEKCGNHSATAIAAADGGWSLRQNAALPNKGEECTAYLHYLRDYYAKLPHFTIFLQGDGVMGGKGFKQKFSAFGHTITTNPHSIWRSVNDHQYISISSSFQCSQLGLVNCEANEQQVKCLRALHEAHLGPAPVAFSVFANAQFGVSRDRMRARSRSWYARLLSTFDGPPEQECFQVTWGKKARPFRGTCSLLEFLWPVIMGEGNILDPSRTMRNADLGIGLFAGSIA